LKTFRNDFGEDRIVPTLGYHLVEPGDTILVPDEEWEHWDAGGWTPLDDRPESSPAEPAAATEPAPSPPAAVSKPAAKTAAPAPEGTENA
jgi:hypothetical protein